MSKADERLIDIAGARRKRTADDRSEPLFTDTPTVKLHRYDSEDSSRLHNRLYGLHSQELIRQESNRAEMAEDEDMYDNKQWKDEDVAILTERGQIPLTYNVLAIAIDWVLGTERRMRTDFKVLPRRKDSGRAALLKTQLLKYLSDINRTGYDVSRAFADAVKVGIGWVEDGVQDDLEGEPVYSRYESWRNMLYDSAATERDLSDARWVSRSKWVDEDVAASLFPDRKGTITGSIDDGSRVMGIDEDGDDAMDSHERERESFERGVYDPSSFRRRVRLIEVWYRVPMEVDRIRGGEFHGEINDEFSPGHVDALNAGEAELVRRTVFRMHVAIMTNNGLLYVGESPYRHNDFPFTPIFGKVRGRDNMPYGMIRGQKDIQVDINKRASKALHILSTNKVIMETGAVDDLDAFAEEVSRPDAIIVKNPGKVLELNAERELAPAHLELMSRGINMIQQTSGVTDENMGRSTNATSGVAIERRQDQGSLAVSGYFDSLRFARQIQGEKQLSLIEQFFTETKQFRITNQRGTPEYVSVNDDLPENDITRSKADFVISEDSWNATRRQAEVQEMMALLQQLAPVAPQVVLATLDIVFESMDLPSRDELVKRIRAITGQRDPDAEEPTPEEIAQAQQQQKQAEMQERAANAEISLKEAQAAKAAADTEKAKAGAADALAALAGRNITSQKTALEAALMMISAPATAPVADSLLHEANFQSRTEGEESDRMAGVMQGEAEAQQAMAMQEAQAQQQAAQAEQQQRQHIDDAKKEVDPLQREAITQQQRAAEEQAAQAAAQQQNQPQQ